MKLIIAGGRDFFNKQLMYESYMGMLPCATEIVSGLAKGADTLGILLAKELGIPVKCFPPNWKKYGKRAGLLRNIDMANYADGLLAFWDGHSTGTKHMIEVAQQKKLIVEVIRYASSS